ncbi:hypothetical protein HBN83_22805 [Pseudomonas fragi]|uniref:hypothetical protein n=1 Tax=Pseudomonas fragi TaxID=296 RepID=UPI001473C715|nr:hypothetical protein [Pseudomonas fragi]NNB08732.1 hypothetical protein [Pseudomonas fragi]
MSTTFEQSRAAELVALTQVAETIRTAATLDDLHAASAQAVDRLQGALRDNVISGFDYLGWAKRLDAAEAERRAEL